MTVRVFDAAKEAGFREATLDEIKDRERRVALWIDLTGPTQAEIEQVGRIFGFHRLAIEDARKRQQRPKVDVYHDHLFVVLYALDPPEAHQDRPELQEIAMFITDNEVVTIHRHEVEEINVAALRWAQHCGSGLVEDPAMLAYTISDSVVDGYFPCMDEIGDRIEALESEMFETGGGEDALQQVFRLKRLLLDMRRVVSPTRDVFNSFTRREMPLLGDVSLAYFQDVYDHVIRVTDSIDSYRDILSTVIDVHLTLVSNKLNKTVQRLTSASIILMSLALVAGIYGMNFHLTPSEDWRWGFEFAVGSMVVIGSGLLVWFRRMGWW